MIPHLNRPYSYPLKAASGPRPSQVLPSMQVQSTVCGGAQRGEWKQDGNLSSGCKGESTANAVGKKEIERD